jgi:S1-C subfamily serine protease
MKKVASTANDELQGLDEFRVSSVFRRPLAPLALTLIALEQLPITDAPKKEEGKKEVTIPTVIAEKEAKKDGTEKFPEDSAAAKAYEAAKKGTVMVEARRPAKEEGKDEISTGTGFIVSEDGLVASAYHVVHEFGTPKIKMPDGKEYETTVVAEDKKNDLVLLKVKLKDGDTTKFPALELAEKVNFKMKQPIFVLGHYNGWDKAYLAPGEIDGAASLENIVPKVGDEDPKRKLVAVHAKGSEGTSGGPALDETGKVVGVADKAATSGRGDHIFITPLSALQGLIKAYQDKEKK